MIGGKSLFAPPISANQIRDSYTFFPGTPMPVSVLSAFLRMGKKYVIRQLFKEAEKCLSFSMPQLAYMFTKPFAENVVLFSRVSGTDPFNFMVMNVATEVGLLSATIVVAIYCCIACPAFSIADGYDFSGIQCVLSASNKRYCLLLQHYLAEVERQLFQSIAHPASNCGIHASSTQRTCATGLLSNLRAIQSLKYPFTKWMASWDNDLCVTCRVELRKKHEETRVRYWDKLPIALGLGPWETIDKDAEIA